MTMARGRGGGLQRLLTYIERDVRYNCMSQTLYLIDAIFLKKVNCFGADQDTAVPRGPRKEKYGFPEAKLEVVVSTFVLSGYSLGA